MNDGHSKFAASFFSTRPDADAQPLGIPVWRAPAKGEAGCVCLSSDVLGCWTHFWRGRTQPCLGDACTICADEITRRWKGWLIGWSPKDRSLRVVELPAGPAVAAADFSKERGSLRGCGIKLSRRNNKANGPVQITITGGVVDEALLPPCPDVAVLMLRIFQIKQSNSLIVREDPARIYAPDDLGYTEGQTA